MATASLSVLSIDIGGSHIKCTILNAKGELQTEYKRVETPDPATPANVIKTIKTLITGLPAYDKVSVGFPGYVRDGIVHTAPNLGTEAWAKVNLAEKLAATTGKPVQVVNDADMQGLGVASGKGLEMVVTLGTGFGTALLLDGKLLPHLELAHHPFTKNNTYDQYIGEAAMNRHGVEKWNERMKRVFATLKTVFNYDRLYIGGGNAKDLNFPLEKDMKLVTNKDGIKGGAKLWNS